MRFWVIIVTLSILIVTVGFILLATVHPTGGLSNAEKQQALKELLGRTPILTAKTNDTSTKIFTGKYLSVVYPTSARIYTESRGESQDVFSFGIVDEHITVSSGVYANGITLSEYGGVVLRTLQKDTYKESTAFFQGLPCLSFLKEAEGVEKSLFCQKDGEILSYVVTGADKDTVETYYIKTLQTIRF